MNKPSEEGVTNENLTGDETVFSERDAHTPSEYDHSPTADDMQDYKFLKSKSVKESSGHSSHSGSSSGHHHHHHHRRHHRRRKKMKKGLKIVLIIVSVILAIAIVLGGVGFYLVNRGQDEMMETELNVIVPAEVPATVQDDGDYIVYNGSTYRYNKDITSLLFMGIDKRDFDDENEEGTGGQVDVIVMIAMNTKARKLSLIAVPRDTITEVALYTPSGHYNGMEKAQVSLAYAYGDGKESSCDNTVSSVRRLFYNIPVKTYYTLDLDGIAAMNDAVGGVDVVSPETIAEFVEGESYHLEGKQAESFVRSRDKSKVESSLQRLERQKVYARGFLTTMSSTLKKDITKAVSLFNESAPYSITNLNAAKVTYLAKEFAFGGGMSAEMASVPGTMSYDGELARYTVDEKAFFEQFLSVYYEKM